MALETTNISMSLIRNTLSEVTNKLSLLCLSVLINMWSRNKPVRGSWPAASDGKYGLSLSLWSNPSGTFTPTNWEYLRPRGLGYSEGFRMGDFRGYEHNSALTFPPGYCKDSDQDENSVLSPAQPMGGVASGTAVGKFNTTNASVRIRMSDLGLGSYYFGVLLVTPSGKKYIQTANTAISASSEETGLSVVYSAALDDPTIEGWKYVNLPKEVGVFAAHYVISSVNYYSNSGVWTENPSATIYRLPSGSVSGMTFKNTFSFTVGDWIYAATGSLSFAYDDDTALEYQETVIYMSGDGVFTVDLTEATWAEYEVYAPDGVTKVTNPSLWGNGYRLRVFPINANGGAAKEGTIYVDASNVTPYPISVTHQAAPALVSVYTGDDSKLTITEGAGHVIGGLFIEFTPHYVPGGDPAYDVCYLIKVNDIEVYSSLTSGIACTNDTHKNSTSIDYGSATWEDGDLIDVFLYHEEAPEIS